MKRLQMIENWALWLCVATFPFIMLPHKLSIPGLGGNLPMLFILLAIITLGMEALCYHTVEFPYKRFLIFYSGWVGLTIIIGAIQFPYYHEISIGVLQDSSFGKFVIHLLGYMDECWILSIGLFSTFFWRGIRDLVFLPIGIFLLIYHLYGKNWQHGFNCILQAVRMISVLCCVYSSIEIFWLWTGNSGCENLLKYINVWLYDPEQANGWWPPLLWYGQARSVFQEPSFLGIGEIFLLPFLWYSTICKRRKLDITLFLCLLLMLFMTNARTALVIYGLELLALVFLGMILHYPHWKRYTVYILLISLCMFGVNILANNIVNPLYNKIIQDMGYSYDQDVKKDKLISASEYVAKNITSVTGIQERSNAQRYGNIVAMVNVGMMFPVFGVGFGYESKYMENQFPAWSQDNPEVKLWTSEIEKKGILKAGYPFLNQYTATFMREGVIGILLFLFAPFYIFYQVYKQRKNLYDFRAVCILIVVWGQMVCMLSNSVFITYFIGLSLLACFAFNQRKGDKDN